MAGGRGGGRGPMPREVQVSKKLSWLLRHNAEKEGLQLGAGGYINVKDVVSALSSDTPSNDFHQLFPFISICLDLPHPLRSCHKTQWGTTTYLLPWLEKLSSQWSFHSERRLLHYQQASYRQREGYGPSTHTSE